MTKKGSLIPKVYLGSKGAVTKLVVTFEPIISKTLELMS